MDAITVMRKRKCSWL